MSIIPDQVYFLRDLCTLVLFANDLKFAMTEGEGERPQWVEDIYRKQGKSKVEQSQHTLRLAHDFHFYDFSSPNGKYMEITDYKRLKSIGEFWKSLSPKNRWGGDWKNPYDPWHFERTV